jgi:hypothetical protein
MLDRGLVPELYDFSQLKWHRRISRKIQTLCCRDLPDRRGFADLARANQNLDQRRFFSQLARNKGLNIFRNPRDFNILSTE